mgnify:CR=1 FL=1
MAQCGDVAEAAQHNKSCYQDELSALVADAGLPLELVVVDRQGPGDVSGVLPG